MGGQRDGAGSQPGAGREAVDAVEPGPGPEAEAAQESSGGLRLVDARMLRLARKRALHYPGTVRTAPKGPGESSLGTEEEDQRLWQARVLAWRRSQGEAGGEETKG